MVGRERILVVEDDPVMATLFGELLPAIGLEMTLTETAEDALRLLERETFDLVVADMNLPGASGLDLLAHVKQEIPHLDVILMTAYVDMQSVLEAVQQGVYDYLVKPFDSFDDVTQKIHRALDKRRIMLENVRLVRHLTEANRRIEEMNRQLERKVEERTEQLQQANKRLQELTLIDDVSELYNQRFLYPRLDEEFRRVRRYGSGLSVIMIDLDHFKDVNDNHDHLFGTRVLRRVGKIIKSAVRNTDLAVRYGGDEFCLVLPHTESEEAVIVAERVRGAIAGRDVGDNWGDDPEFPSGAPYNVTASIGVASFGCCSAENPRALLRAADMALYAAKAGGRNRVGVMRNDTPVASVG